MEMEEAVNTRNWEEAAAFGNPARQDRQSDDDRIEDWKVNSS